MQKAMQLLDKRDKKLIEIAPPNREAVSLELDLSC